MRDDDVTVVGGGLSGLAAAATAARAGARVTLLEAAAELGGRARTIDVTGGYRLDHGPHALYGGGPAERVLGALGVAPAGRKPSTRHHRLLRGGALVAPPYDVAGARHAAALRILPRVLLARPEAHAGRSAAEWIAATAPAGPARDLLGALVRTAGYTAALDALPAPIAITQVQRSVRPGVRYLDGGWGRLVDDLAGAAREAGAALRTRAKVEAVLAGGRGVRLAGGEEREAGAVVLAGLGPATVARLVAPAGGADPLPGARPAEAACLAVALRRLPRPDQRFVMGVDVPVLVTETSRAARDVAPPGGAVVHVGRYLRDGADRPGRAELEAVLELVQPGWREVLVDARFLARLVVAHHLGARPAADAARLPGVVLAGDWIGEEGWLSDAALATGAAAGGRAAARAAGAWDPAGAVAVAS